MSLFEIPVKFFSKHFSLLFAGFMSEFGLARSHSVHQKDKRMLAVLMQAQWNIQWLNTLIHAVDRKRTPNERVASAGF